MNGTIHYFEGHPVHQELKKYDTHLNHSPNDL